VLVSAPLCSSETSGLAATCYHKRRLRNGEKRRKISPSGENIVAYMGGRQHQLLGGMAYQKAKRKA